MTLQRMSENHWANRSKHMRRRRLSRVPVLCPDKFKLMTHYRITTPAYSFAVSELERSVQTSDKVAFDDILCLSLDARRLSNEARKNLRKHIAEHGC